ncbi:hypothetical protein MA16_Dca024641 [Dendrobium catenatum]|uniref:Uncharacterized protein n=1 Tax=Dendrobium catenatum TaxID=906689 RepID=A0A2I0V8C7_9ASPA|nr:hypothetical protein MA16_Dca024641 [Dendrobium catenatum]
MLVVVLKVIVDSKTGSLAKTRSNGARYSSIYAKTLVIKEGCLLNIESMPVTGNGKGVLLSEEITEKDSENQEKTYKDCNVTKSVGNRKIDGIEDQNVVRQCISGERNHVVPKVNEAGEEWELEVFDRGKDGSASHEVFTTGKSLITGGIFRRLSGGLVSGGFPAVFDGLFPTKFSGGFPTANFPAKFCDG